jgi:hypothetical protein
MGTKYEIYAIGAFEVLGFVGGSDATGEGDFPYPPTSLEAA